MVLFGGYGDAPGTFGKDLDDTWTWERGQALCYSASSFAKTIESKSLRWVDRTGHRWDGLRYRAGWCPARVDSDYRF